MRLAGVAKVLAVRGRLPGANCSTARIVIAYLPSLTSVLHRDSLRRSATLGIARVSVPEAGTLSPPRGAWRPAGSPCHLLTRRFQRA